MNAPAIRLPPHSVEAEQSLIGGLLLDNRALDRASDLIAESDFYRDDHRRIFGHIRKLIETGKPADVVTVFESIERSNETDQTGGLAYLGEIANATPSAANIRRYAEIVADRAARRRLMVFAGQVDALARSSGDASSAIDEAQRLISELADTGVSRSEPTAISQILCSVIDDLEARAERGSDISGIPTGFVELDRKLSGLHRGDLVIIAGRPAMGKTTLALNIAENVAVSGKPALVFSLEMGIQRLVVRVLASLGAIPLDHLRNAKLTDDEWDRLTVALGRLHQSSLDIDESTGLTVTQMAARARRVSRKYGGLALVVIDYLQLMRGEGSNRNEELGDLTRRLKLMAKDLDVPVILLSQLSRKVEERTNKRPLMSDLRESGAIEQDADVILMVYRDDYYNKESPEAGTAEVIVSKHRNGSTGDIRLAFQGELSRFRDLAADEAARMRSASEKRSQQQPRSRGFRQ